MKNSLPSIAEGFAAFGVIAMACFPFALSAEVINRGVEGGPMSEIRPAPKSIYPDQKMITAQPSPSEVDSAYLGPVLLMKSAIVDLENGTATLPLRKGRMESGETVWSIMTDATDQNLANLHGVVYSPKLAYAVNGKATRQARIEKDGTLVFKSGKVDFSPVHSVTPGHAPDFFPPKAAQPGSVGDADYSPLVEYSNSKGTLFNMPMVAYDVSAADLDKMCEGGVDYSKVEDKVVKIWDRHSEAHSRLHLRQADLLPLHRSQRSRCRRLGGRDLHARAQRRAFRTGGCITRRGRGAALYLCERTHRHRQSVPPRPRQRFIGQG